MRRPIITVFVCAIATWFVWTHVVPASAAVYPHRPFLTGDGFLGLSQSERRDYAIGVVEGMLASPYLGASIERASRLNECLSGKDGAEIVAILSGYLGEHAEERRYDMPTVTLRALAALCGTEPYIQP